MDAIAIRLEAIAGRLEAIASRNKENGKEERPKGRDIPERPVFSNSASHIVQTAKGFHVHENRVPRMSVCTYETRNRISVAPT